MKHIEVVAAIIHKDGMYFATQRGYGEFENMWEFPGGKIEAGESHDCALKREILEELDININIEEFICTSVYEYPTFHLRMHCYLCSIPSGQIVLKEHKSAKWLNANDLESVDWLPADKVVIELIKKASNIC